MYQLIPSRKRKFEEVMDNRTPKRKMFSCTHCEGPGSGCVGERYRVIDHVMKHHMALDQTPYYCNLCMFRCTSQDQLNRHVTSYKRHATMAAMAEFQGDASRYLVHNPNAKTIEEGIDYRAVPEEQEQSGPSKPTQSQVTGTSEQGGTEELVTVRLSPAVLASLLSTNNASQKTQTQAVPPALQYDPSRPGMTESETNAFISSLLDAPSTSTGAGTGRPLQQTTPTAETGSATYRPTPIVPKSPQLRIPDLPVNRSRSHTPALSIRSAFSPLTTPDVFSRRTSNVDENMIFSPQPAPAQVVQQEPPKTTATQATQTEPEAAPTPRVDSLAPLNAVLGHFEKTMEVAMGKMIFAVESVARATRHVQQSIDALGTTVSQVTRAVDRLTDEQRRLARSRESTGNQSNKRAREDEDKENDRALKSVVSKKNSSNRRN